jgi:hypothetical protein
VDAESSSRSLKFVVATVVQRGKIFTGALQVVTAGLSSRYRLQDMLFGEMPYSYKKKLDTEPLGLAHAYKAEFKVELSEVLKEAADKSSWTTTFESEVDGQKYEMQYTLDCTKVWKQELHLMSTENKRLTISSFKSKIGRDRSWIRDYMQRGSHQALYKTFIEKEVETKIENLTVFVTVELLRTLSPRAMQKYELVGTLLENVEETGDVELRGKDFVVKAHSIVLSMRSSTLKTKFERWTDGLPFIFNLDESIPDDVTRALVHYYTEKIPKINAFANTHSLFKLADQLGQLHLMKHWGRAIRLGEEETPDIMLWPELDLPQMNRLRSRVEDAAIDLSRKEIGKHGLDLAREVLLAVKRRQDAGVANEEGNKSTEYHGHAAVSEAEPSTSESRYSDVDTASSSNGSKDSEDGPVFKRAKT